jgi:undecaprenyl diphosphate synthase
MLRCGPLPRVVATRPSMSFVSARNLPAHIGIIMDGNGRWAQKRGAPRSAGHKEGAAAVRRVVRASRRLGLKALTLYAFSEQNWARPGDEVESLMELLREFLISEHDEILLNGIRLAAVGCVDRLPAHVREVLDPLRAESAKNHEMTLSLALSYGGREEILNATRDIARAAVAGSVDPETLTMQSLIDRIPSIARTGDPDLIIRTGGERRISNFLLFGAAYAELYFADALWPDFGEADLHTAIESYQQRERRFGLVGTPAAEERVPEPRAAETGAKIIRLAI